MLTYYSRLILNSRLEVDAVLGYLNGSRVQLTFVNVRHNHYGNLIRKIVVIHVIIEFTRGEVEIGYGRYLDAIGDGDATKGSWSFWIKWVSFYASSVISEPISL